MDDAAARGVAVMSMLLEVIFRKEHDPISKVDLQCAPDVSVGKCRGDESTIRRKRGENQVK